MRDFDVEPKRDLGQSFLVDDNILRLIGAEAELTAGDVVLEVGGGLGVLSEHLAPRVGHLHVVEIDPALEAPLREALGPFEGSSTLHMGDALELCFGELAPPPDKVVANLPYGVAATVLLKSIEELPAARRWVAMVQREVAERLAASPGGRTYGATSVIAQLSCGVRLARRVPATVFRPVPRVESALCVMSRVRPSPHPAVVELVHAAFRHRRKTLPGSLALSVARSGGAELRARARLALGEVGHPPDARAERLSPEDFLALAERLGPIAATRSRE